MQLTSRMRNFCMRALYRMLHRSDSRATIASMPQRVTLLGVPIDALRREEAIECLLAMLHTGGLRRAVPLGGHHHVMTPNSEMLVEAARNPVFRELLSRTNLNIPDSVGLLFMARLTGQYLPERVTGVDTVTAFCARLGPEHPVFLLGSAPGVAERAAQELKKRNTNLIVVGTCAGSPRTEDAPAILEQIRNAKPHVLFVAFGAPEQDFWIDRHLKDLPSVCIAMGVGGTFDFLTGVQRRAPRFLRTLGFEWLWRLLKEPKRIRRIWNAVAVFPFLVLFRHERS